MRLPVQTAYALSLARALRGPYAGLAWDACVQPRQETVGWHRNLEIFAEAVLGAMRRAPKVGADSMGVLPCVARDDGLWLEFGVYKGGTIRKIARFRNITRREERAVVYGFDSFFGLPETWQETSFRPGGLRRGQGLTQCQNPPVFFSQSH